MKIETMHQCKKLLEVALLCTFLMFVFELIFSFDAVTNWLKDLVINAGNWTWVVVWVLLFVQVLIPIPAYVIILAVFTILPQEMTTYTTLVCVAISAYMLGAIIAYGIGRKWGKIAVKWCAGSEQEYDKWASFINKKGKFIYFLTVLFPVFPDDILCIVCGSVKFNFCYFIIFNFVGRTIGLITTLVFFGIISGGGILTLVAWGAALVVEIIAWLVFRSKIKKYNKSISVQQYIQQDYEQE